jgi:hypothetical protein
MQFASFKVKIQMEEVLFLINQKRRTPSRFCRIAKMKGDKMFRSNWENGESGTPEQWKIEPKINYPSDSCIFIYKDKVIIKS